MIDLELRPADGLERAWRPSLVPAAGDLPGGDCPTETAPSTRPLLDLRYVPQLRGELGKIAAKAGIRFVPEESEHGIHGHFVQLAGKAGRAAKLTHKVLDRKYRSAIDRFRRAKSDIQFAELRDRALAEGDVPGPYWALMTHPRATSVLMVKAFGEVHMLSHLAGATNRADTRRLRATVGRRVIGLAQEGEPLMARCHATRTRQSGRAGYGPSRITRTARGCKPGCPALR